MATAAGDQEASAEGAAAPTTSDVTTITKKRKNELEDDSSKLKRVKSSIASVARELLCPITQELPFDPVTAEDGHVYEREAIQAHIKRQRDDVKSPMTNEPMGINILSSVHVRNTIQHLIDSGVIDGDLAETWKQRKSQKDRVDETFQKANGGDSNAMYLLGYWYQLGYHGLSRDIKEAYNWYKKAADKKNVKGMACAGICLVLGGGGGGGVKANISQGISLMSIAAGMGSNYACNYLGMWYCYGYYGFPKDMSEAKYWTQKAVDGTCTVKHMAASCIEQASKRLQRIERAQASDVM